MILVNFGDQLVHGDFSPRAIAQDNSLGYIDKSFSNPTSNLAIYKEIVKTSLEITDTDQYIFLIGWTTSNNIQFRYENKDIVFQKEKYNHSMKLYDKLNKFNHYLFEPVLTNQQRLGIVHATQEVLKSRSIKFYMYNIQNKIDYNNYTAKSLKNIDSKLYHNPLSADSTMLGYIHKQKLDMQKGTKAWFKFVSQKMRAVGVLEK